MGNDVSLMTQVYQSNYFFYGNMGTATETDRLPPRARGRRDPGRAIVAAYGDAVVPQIIEAIGHIIGEPISGFKDAHSRLSLPNSPHRLKQLRTLCTAMPRRDSAQPSKMNLTVRHYCS
jgi:hypothetical protein